MTTIYIYLSKIQNTQHSTNKTTQKQTQIIKNKMTYHKHQSKQFHHTYGTHKATTMNKRTHKTIQTQYKFQYTNKTNKPKTQYNTLTNTHTQHNKTQTTIITSQQQPHTTQQNTNDNNHITTTTTHNKHTTRKQHTRINKTQKQNHEIRNKQKQRTYTTNNLYIYKIHRHTHTNTTCIYLYRT